MGLLARQGRTAMLGRRHPRLADEAAWKRQPTRCRRDKHVQAEHTCAASSQSPSAAACAAVAAFAASRAARQLTIAMRLRAAWESAAVLSACVLQTLDRCHTRRRWPPTPTHPPAHVQLAQVGVPPAVREHRRPALQRHLLNHHRQRGMVVAPVVRTPDTHAFVAHARAARKTHSSMPTSHERVAPQAPLPHTHPYTHTCAP